jgi:hypothetical protein
MKNSQQHFLVFVVFLCSWQFASSQVSTFELSDYKLTDVRFQSYTNQLRFNQNGQTDKNMFSGSLKTRNNNSSVNYNGLYTLYTNSRPSQRITSVSTYFVGNRSVYEFGDEGDRNRYYRRNYHWNSGVQVNDVHRKYITSTLFLEAQFLAKYEFQQIFNFEKNWTPAEIKDRLGEDRHLFSVGAPVKIGLGRLERVEDARQALFLMEALQKVGRLSDSISQQDYLNLSAFVSKLRNKRFFDVRLQRIYQVKALDTFMRRNKLTRETDAPYFTTTYDYWMYGGNPIRQSGRRFAVAFYPMIARQSERRSQLGFTTTLEANYKKSFQQGFVALECDIEKPFRQKWQSSLNGRLFMGKRINKYLTESILNEIDEKYNVPSIQFKVNYGLGFYPSTRTSITWNTSIDLARVHSVYTTDKSFTNSFDFDMDRNIFSTNLQATYYVSPRFRIAANIDLRLIRIPTFQYIFDGRGFVLNYVPSVDIADSYFSPDQLINTPGQYYNFEESRLNTNVYLRILYSLF